jgi:signal transduction histidine kinase
VEICALAVFLGVRVVGLAQLAVALPTALRHATSVPLFVAVLAGYLAESALVAVLTVRARGYRDARLGWLDTAVAALVLLAQPGFIARADSTGSWTAWGFALTLGSAAGAAIVFGRRWQAALAVGVLAGSYLAASLPSADGASMRTTIISNALAYAGFAVLTWLLVGYLRRLAADAERAREAATVAAAETARLREVDRQRLLLHDNIGVLSLLARTDLPPGLADPLRQQATELANRVRRFLDDAADGVNRSTERADSDVTRGQVALVEVVHRAAQAFGDLPLELSTDLAAAVFLPHDIAEALGQALTTLLANVRLHAAAELVVLHGDADPAEHEWEVTVRDNGRGFDPAATPRGFGLRVQVEQALADRGVSTHIHSMPGDGTSVTLRGPWEPS